VPSLYPAVKQVQGQGQNATCLQDSSDYFTKIGKFELIKWLVGFRGWDGFWLLLVWFLVVAGLVFCFWLA